MRRILLPLLSIAALLLAPDLALAGDCNSANGCATLEHDPTTNAKKVVHVDSTGTVLAGGRGSRVELIASGTSTSAAASAVIVAYTADTFPSWAHSVQVVMRVSVITGSPANLSFTMGGTDNAGNVLGSGNWVVSGTIPSPVVGSYGMYVGGRDAPPSVSQIYNAYGVSGSAAAMIMATTILPRNFSISRSFGVTPTTCTITYQVYAIGG